MIYVYELRVEGRVIDVGVTSRDIKIRLNEHTKYVGKYLNRTDITIHTVSEWPTRKLAFKEEGRLKLSYGFEWTESTHCIAGLSRRQTTIEIAKEIRSKYIPYKYTASMLAKEYNLTLGVAKGIVENVYYKDV